MTYTTLRVAATALATLASVAMLLTNAAHAQSSSGNDRTRGFVLGVHSIAAPGVKISGGDINGEFSTTFGAGAGVTVGYGINRIFSGFTSLDVAKQKTGEDVFPQGSYGLAHFEVGARANLPLGGSATVPYVTASVGRRALSARITTDDGDQADATMSGGMLSVGGGIEHFFSPTMAIDAGVGVGYGKFNQFKVADDTWDPNANATTSVRLRVGVTWRPLGRRSS